VAIHQRLFSHGALFIYDQASHDLQFSEIDGHSCITITPGYAVIGVMVDVNGPVSVDIAPKGGRHLPDFALRVARFQLNCPGKSLTIAAVEPEPIEVWTLQKDTVWIEVALDDVKFPGHVWITIET
jgi:hypothetical protein